MRFPRLIITIVSFSVLVFLGLRIYGFTRLFFTHSGTPLTQFKIRQNYASDQASDTPREEVIPRIIHQIFHNWKQPGNETIPENWDQARQSCLEKNAGWEYWLWTEKTSRDFLEENYPWFLGTYDGYRFPVQRVDSLKYFLMLRFGGIYLDLDNGCRTPLEALLIYPTFVTDGGQGMLSNNILGSVPEHPFWRLLTTSLPRYNYNYLLPYVTISYASGQWFETAIWERYHQLVRQGRIDGESEELMRVRMDSRNGEEERMEWLFTQGKGGTWVHWDNLVFLWVGEHLFSVGVVILGAGMAVVMVWCRRKRAIRLRSRQNQRKGYANIEG